MGTADRSPRLFRLLTRLDGMGERFFAAQARAAGDPGLSRARGELLLQIRSAGGRLQVQDLAERTGRTTSAAAELAAKLCRDGYAFKLRVAGDGRGVWVVLSARGRRAAALYTRILADLAGLVDRNLTDGELARMEKIAHRIEAVIAAGLRS